MKSCCDFYQGNQLQKCRLIRTSGRRALTLETQGLVEHLYCRGENHRECPLYRRAVGPTGIESSAGELSCRRNAA
jgi:hypothetical protein